MKKAWASAGLTLLAVSAYASNLTIDSFISVQGPNQATAWSDPATGNFMVFDAFGKRDDTNGLNLGTTITGRVTNTTIGDGTDRVTVAGPRASHHERNVSTDHGLPAALVEHAVVQPRSHLHPGKTRHDNSVRG